MGFVGKIVKLACVVPGYGIVIVETNTAVIPDAVAGETVMIEAG